MNIWKVCVLQMEFEVKRLFLWEVEDKVQEGGDAYCQSLRMYLSMKLNLFGSIYMYMYTYICQSWKVCVLQMEFEVERIFLWEVEDKVQEGGDRGLVQWHSQKHNQFHHHHCHHLVRFYHQHRHHHYRHHHQHFHHRHHHHH